MTNRYLDRWLKQIDRKYRFYTFSKFDEIGKFDEICTISIAIAIAIALVH